MRAPAPDVERGVGPGKPLHGAANDLRAGRARQGGQLIERNMRVPQGIRAGNLDRDQKGALWALFILEGDEPVSFCRTLCSCESCVLYMRGATSSRRTVCRDRVPWYRITA
jgi:hypothetical protein